MSRLPTSNHQRYCPGIRPSQREQHFSEQKNAPMGAQINRAPFPKPAALARQNRLARARVLVRQARGQGG